jgi:hypothetical protein
MTFPQRSGLVVRAAVAHVYHAVRADPDGNVAETLKNFEDVGGARGIPEQ